VPGEFEVTRSPAPGGAVLAVVGELDVATAPVLASALAAESGRLVLDLSGLTFCDAAGIGVMLRSRTRLRTAGGDLVLLAPPPLLRRLLTLLRLDAELPVERGWTSGTESAASPG